VPDLYTWNQEGNPGSAAAKNKFEDEKFVQLERNECTKKMTKFLDSLDLFFPLSLSFLISSFVSWNNVKNGSLGMKGKKHKAKWVFEREKLKLIFWFVFFFFWF
jgi:hypothetical protein